ncbi:PREDICTED: THAP domain-containing protein 7, partial [Chaetura pelagica]|uniref:THAP domain-containing protein 7 n=1 Tax=Chaetura pelagica TaxID=8897 RepID=UPI0005231F4B
LTPVAPVAPSPPRPVSPSAYMRRLPPPAGSYIQREHSYPVGSALRWKRRAEAALDALDRAQRQLQACISSWIDGFFSWIGRFSWIDGFSSWIDGFSMWIDGFSSWNGGFSS